MSSRAGSVPFFIHSLESTGQGCSYSYNSCKAPRPPFVSTFSYDAGVELVVVDRQADPAVDSLELAFTKMLRCR